MSRWIKRSEQEPPKGVVVVHTDGENFWTVKNISHQAWTHWLSIPAPPPRTVTIEISEEMARRYAEIGDNSEIINACRKALGAEE